jgi:DNA ligase-1
MVKLLESGVQDTPKKKKGGNGGKKKPLPATYEPDQRSQGWLKVKKGKSFFVAWS